MCVHMTWPDMRHGHVGDMLDWTTQPHQTCSIGGDYTTICLPQVFGHSFHNQQELFVARGHKQVLECDKQPRRWWSLAWHSICVCKEALFEVTDIGLLWTVQTWNGGWDFRYQTLSNLNISNWDRRFQTREHGEHVFKHRTICLLESIWSAECCRWWIQLEAQRVCSNSLLFNSAIAKLGARGFDSWSHSLRNW